MNYLLGAHFSIAKGLEKALYTAEAYQCNALQIFTKNANTWKERTITGEETDRFDRAREKTGIRIIASHTSYLINLASKRKEVREKSFDALKSEMERSQELGISFVVLHPGANNEAGVRIGIELISAKICEILTAISGKCPRLLLETTAGQGSALGNTFEQLAEIMARIDMEEKSGICLDTSHIFAAGYDLRTRETYERTLKHFEETVGLKNLHLIHLNDSKRKLGSGIDRHEHIGEGFIGDQAFKFLMNDKRLSDIPKIIETPKNKNEADMDTVNLNRLRQMIDIR